ncbi:helix-turn-helix domain-containing protein [Pseudoclavibacter sp. AY1H1]|uniref:helix-turn-helix domain-containing protein n=1 Tax=Pseudoclavibacter sp. AY1H1 TaxID=2080584 RepID=UPI000CE7333F|nr:helix-turn-helix domain-containing protein [Pseudoclavibacter sp. AY1H1]PPF39994.1 hypothetical protein C5E05_01915 [Pseudoclavibacter sp. AY1H1]
MKRRPQDEEHSRKLAAAARRLAQAHADREAAVLAAHAAGMPRAHIAEDVGLSPMHISRIVKAAQAHES